MEAVPGIDAVCAPRQYTNTKPGSHAAAVGKLRIVTGTALAQSVLLYLHKPSRRFLPKRQYLPVTMSVSGCVCTHEADPTIIITNPQSPQKPQRPYCFITQPHPLALLFAVLTTHPLVVICCWWPAAVGLNEPASSEVPTEGRERGHGDAREKAIILDADRTRGAGKMAVVMAW